MTEPRSVERRRPPGAAISPDEQLRRHLRPGERLRWSARPDPRTYAASKMRPGYYGLVITGLWLLWFVIALFQAGPAALLDPEVMGYSLLLLLPGLWLLSVPFRHARNSRRIACGITDRRLIIAAEKPSKAVLSFAPREIQFIQRFDYESGLGSLFFSKATTPDHHAWRRRSGWARIGFMGIPDAARVEEMILAVSRLRGPADQGKGEKERRAGGSGGWPAAAGRRVGAEPKAQRRENGWPAKGSISWRVMPMSRSR